MRASKRTLLSFFAVALLALAAGCPQSGTETTGGGDTTATTGTSGTSGAGATQAMGNWSGDAIDFMYTGFAGSSGSASDFAGKPLVVNFWAAW